MSVSITDIRPRVASETVMSRTGCNAVANSYGIVICVWDSTSFSSQVGGPHAAVAKSFGAS
jgi:hypothetical protein